MISTLLSRKTSTAPCSPQTTRGPTTTVFHAPALMARCSPNCPRSNQLLRRPKTPGLKRRQRPRAQSRGEGGGGRELPWCARCSGRQPKKKTGQTTCAKHSPSAASAGAAARKNNTRQRAKHPISVSLKMGLTGMSLRRSSPGEVARSTPKPWSSKWHQTQQTTVMRLKGLHLWREFGDNATVVLAR